MEQNENTEKMKASPRTSARYETSRGKRKKAAQGKAILIAALLGAVLSGVVTYLVFYKKAQKEYEHLKQPIIIEESEVLDKLKGNLEAGTGVTTSLRQSFKNYLIINDGSRYIFAPINYDLKMHNRVKENLDTAGAMWSYEKKGRPLAKKGIDVSSHQGSIDWAKVKADGVEFAICRACYRGYGEEGNLRVDDTFEYNAGNAAANDITVGAYLFSQATDKKELDEEVELLLKTIAPYEIKGPVVMDIEIANAGEGRADQLGLEERTALAKRFCEKVRAAGYEPALYYNYETALLLLDVAELEDCDKWYASYTSDFYYPYYYKYWQYSEAGTVNGIEGKVDLDLWFED